MSRFLTNQNILFVIFVHSTKLWCRFCQIELFSRKHIFVVFPSFSYFTVFKSHQNKSLTVVFHQASSLQKKRKVYVFNLLIRFQNQILFHQAGGLQNDQSLFFQTFEGVLELSKATNFLKRGFWILFYQTGSIESEHSLFWQDLEPSKVHTFVKKCIWAFFIKLASDKTLVSVNTLLWRYIFIKNVGCKVFTFTSGTKWPLLFQTLELSKTTHFVKRKTWVFFHQANNLQNEQSLPFHTLKFSKALKFCQKIFLGSFSSSGRLTKQVQFAFSSSRVCENYTCQKMCLSTFSQSN